MMKTRSSRVVVALISLPLALLLVSCSGGTNESSDTDSGGDAEASMAEPAAAAPEGALRDDAASTADGDVGVSNTALTQAQTRAVISTGTVTLRAKEVAETRGAVRKVIDTYRGAIAQQETESNRKGELVFARLVLRIPSASFSEAMVDLEEITKFSSVTTGEEDVTTQVIDVEARVRAQTKSLARIEALLAEATTFKDVVAIESQLTSRQAELESLKAQQAYLSDQTSMSTITVYLERLGSDEPEPTDDSGFLAGLSSGWNALGSATVGLLTILGAVLPFALAFAIVGYPLWLVGRRLSRGLPTRRVQAAGAQEPIE